MSRSIVSQFLAANPKLRVSMEAEEPGQTTDGSGVEDELEQVAASAAEDLNDGTAEAVDAAVEDAATDAEGSDDLDTGAADLGQGTEPAAEETPADDAAAGTDEPPANELTPEEVQEIAQIETPAEQILEDKVAEVVDEVVPDAAPEVPTIEEAVVEEVAAAEPAVIDEAPPAAADAPAAAEPQPEPATAPSPTETSAAVQEVVEVVESAANASSAREVLEEVQGIREDLEGARELVEVANENGGVSAESLGFLSLALSSISSRIGMAVPNLGVSLESFAGLNDRQRVSMESIDTMVQVLEEAGPGLERRVVEALERQVAALHPALTSVRERIMDVVSRARASDTDASASAKTVDLDPTLANALLVNGQLPEDVGDYLLNYIRLGGGILNNFAPAAFEAANQASLLVNAVDYSSSRAFWEKIGQAIATVRDPRCTLTGGQLTEFLPGGSQLFGDGEASYESPNEVLQSLIEHNCSYRPLDAMVAAHAPVSSNVSTKALSPAKVVTVGQALLELIDLDKICALTECGKKIWAETQGVLKHVREQLDSAPSDIAGECGPDFSQVLKFVEINYAMATSPLMNYLANLVVTANAFVLYAEKSMTEATEPAPEPVDAPAADPVTEEPATELPAGDISEVDDAALPA